MSGFTLAIHKFKFNMFIFAMFIAGNFIPFQILLVPVRSITIQFGMYDTWYALIIFHVAFQSGFYTSNETSFSSFRRFNFYIYLE